MKTLTLACRLSFVAMASALVLACGDAPPPSAPSNPPSAPTASAPAAPSATAMPSASADPAAAAVPSVWSDSMPKEQQMAFMKTKIVPAMGPVFTAHDATKYADFGCKTCHGPAYKDPHEFLPHLTLQNGNLTAFKEKPAVAKFMAESVSPKMADAMGLPHFDPKTMQGFGCGGCHTIDKK